MSHLCSCGEWECSKNINTMNCRLDREKYIDFIVNSIKQNWKGSCSCEVWFCMLSQDSTLPCREMIYTIFRSGGFENIWNSN